MKRTLTYWLLMRRNINSKLFGICQQCLCGISWSLLQRVKKVHWNARMNYLKAEILLHQHLTLPLQITGRMALTLSVALPLQRQRNLQSIMTCMAGNKKQSQQRAFISSKGRRGLRVHDNGSRGGSTSPPPSMGQGTVL